MSFTDWQEALLLVLWGPVYHALNVVSAFTVLIGFFIPLLSVIRVMRRHFRG